MRYVVRQHDGRMHGNLAVDVHICMLRQRRHIVACMCDPFRRSFLRDARAGYPV